MSIECKSHVDTLAAHVWMLGKKRKVREWEKKVNTIEYKKGLSYTYIHFMLHFGNNCITSYRFSTGKSLVYCISNIVSGKRVSVWLGWNKYHQMVLYANKFFSDTHMTGLNSLCLLSFSNKSLFKTRIW